MILTVYFQALKETDPASHKVTSGRWGKIYGTSLKEKLDLEQGGKIHLPWSYLDSQVWGQGVWSEGGRAANWKGAQVHASVPSFPPGRYRLPTVQNTPRRRWQPPGSFSISWLRAGFSKPALSLNIVLWLQWRYQSSQCELCSGSPPESAALMVQGCIKHSTSPNISWRCTYLKFRTKLPGSHDLQQPSPLMVNAEIKVFPCGCLNFFSSRKGLSLLTHAYKLHFHLAPKAVCIALLYSGAISFAVCGTGEESWYL